MGAELNGLLSGGFRGGATGARPIPLNISSPFSRMRAVRSLCENGNAVRSLRENGNDLIDCVFILPIMSQNASKQGSDSTIESIKKPESFWTPAVRDIGLPVHDVRVRT